MSSSEEMFKLIEDYRTSGKSQKEFCREFGIKPSTFSYWIGKKRLKEANGNGFIKIDASLASSQTLEVCYPNGVMLRVDKRDIALINQLIRTY